MTSTLLQQQQQQQPKLQRTAPIHESTSSAITATTAMAWSNENKLRFSCIDHIGLKQLWKLIALDSTSTTNRANTSNATNNDNNNVNNSSNFNVAVISDLQNQQQQQAYKNNNNNNENIKFINGEDFADFLMNRDILSANSMSLLNYLALNALELSAPATSALIQKTEENCENLAKPPHGWLQLSGHPESIVPTTSGIVRKRVANFTDNEVQAYKQLSLESETSKIVPHFYGTLQLSNGEKFIELQDLLAGFKDPCVMDIKMGSRTFLESEVTNTTLRPDLYQKMVAVDPNAPNAEEREAQAITKLRYMVFREAMSSSHTKGFRIEALRMRGRAPVKDLKTVRTNDQITQTIKQFLLGGSRRLIHKELIKRLMHMRSVIEKSAFFRRHEIVGSSIFIVYDDSKVGVWLIDFAKSRRLPEEINVNHRNTWVPGNREEGLLKGVDELIKAFENVYNSSSATSGIRKCLQI